MAQASNDDNAVETTGASPEGATFVLDLGSKRRKQVKRLRKGTGPLMNRVTDTIDQLREDSELSASSDVVVVIVKQKPKSKRWLFS